MKFVDSHCHLSDPRLQANLDSILESSQKVGIEFFLQGGVGPEDWQQQKILAERYPQNILKCFGLHPYWVADHSEADCESAMDLLAREVSQCSALGEMGLDFRPHIMKDSRERQITFFENQIELAQLASKPMVLHIVRAHEEAQQVLDLWCEGRAYGMLHAFNGSYERAMEYISRGLFISIGGSVTRLDNRKLRDAAGRIPLENLLLESDSPDQPPQQWPLEYNTPASIVKVAETIGFLRGLAAQEVLSICAENFARFLDFKK